MEIMWSLIIVAALIDVVLYIGLEVLPKSLKA